MSRKDFSGKLAFAASQYNKEMEYWLNRLSGNFNKSCFPYDRIDKKSADSDGETGDTQVYDIRFSPELAAALNKLAGSSDPKLHMILASALINLLYRYSGSEDIIIGTPIYRPKVEGEFINTVLPLRFDLEPGFLFKQLLMTFREVFLEAAQHVNYPIEKLLYQLNMEASSESFPLFDIAMLLENIQDIQHIKHIPLSMLFIFSRTGESVTGRVQYRPGQYSREKVEQICNHYQMLLLNGLKDVNAMISRLDIMSDSEKDMVVNTFNASDIVENPAEPLHVLFEQQVERAPLDIAVQDRTVPSSETVDNKLPSTFTYSELNRRANIWAAALRDKGVAPDSIVALTASPSVRALIAILAVLKAGGAYLPIDLDYPEKRIEYILEDSNTQWLLNDGDFNPERFSGTLVNLRDLIGGDGPVEQGTGENLPNMTEPRHMAYVIYTSGSTGNPKGVMVEHGGVVNYIRWASKVYLDGGKFTFPLYSPLSFDLTVTSIYVPLLSGNTLFVYGESEEDNVIETIVEDRKAEILKLTPTHLKILQELDVEDSTLKKLIVGGEELTTHLAADIDRLFNGNIGIYNEYGPTETVVGCMIYRFDPRIDRGKSVPIGKPVDNTRVYILDGHCNPVPPGVAGEIYISGAGVARGYLKNPRLTLEKFGDDVFTGQSRWYRSGDLGVWHPDGNMEFLGRIDHQVKIRGYRIELGEIENKILGMPGINDAVVIAMDVEGNTRDDDNGDVSLCAYYTAPETVTENEMREYLTPELPDFMIPAFFIQLEKMPLTPNGKLDKKALPKPELKSSELYAAPRDELEKQLVKLWADVLRLDEETVGIDDNFFLVGGHSLKATVLVSRLHKSFDVKISLLDIFKHPSVRALAEFVRNSETERHISVEAVEKRDFYKQSPAQKRLFLVYQLDKEATGYNMPEVIVLEGQPDRQRLEETLNKLIRRHESFRTSFELIGDLPVQRVHDTVPFEPEFYHPGPTQDSDEFLEASMKTFVRPFDLSRAPLLRTGLIEYPDRSLLLVDMHHIISDAVSRQLMIADFLQLYIGKDLPPLPLQYKDFSQWQNKLVSSGEIDKQEEFWLRQFPGPISPVTLPFDFERPEVKSFEGDILNFTLDEEATNTLRQLAADEGSTLFIVLFAVYAVFLSKAGNRETVVVGSPIAGRRHVDLEQIVGMFVNTLVLKSQPAGDKSFKQFLEETRDITLNAFENQDYPFESLVEKVVGKRDASHNPIFDVGFVLQNAGEDQQKSTAPGEAAETGEDSGYRNKISKFDMNFIGVETGTNLVFTVEYSVKLFKRQTIDRFIEYFKNLISSLPARIDDKLFEVEMIPGREKQRLLVDLNATSREYPLDKSIHRLFEEQAAAVPDKIAVVYGNQSLTYRQLNESAGRLAAAITARGGRPGHAVGIISDTSLEMIVGTLGILKAGCGYMPINSGYPVERKRYLAGDAHIRILLAAGQGDEGCDVLHTIPLNRGLTSPLQEPGGRPGELSDRDTEPGNNLAYIMYTSGSTGKPKGVMVEHRSVVRLVKNTDFHPFGKDERFLQTGVLEFDASTFEIWGALLNGLELHLCPKETLLDPRALKKAVHRAQITTMWMTAPLFNQMVETDIDIFRTLRYLLVGGDVLSPSHINRTRRRFPRLNVINGYGPTENTTFSTTFAIETVYEKRIPIGRPIANSTVYILDSYLRPVPMGVEGELYVGGHGVSRGYLNRPELTSQTFVPNPFMDGDRLYKTGDIVRWLPQGTIEFLGRKDQQLKIRGFRIETGEIENHLLAHEAITHAVVTPIESKQQGAAGEKSLCAYIVLEPGKPGAGMPAPGLDTAQIREFLLSRLPEHMIPSYFVQLDSIPLTPRGKINFKALPLPGQSVSTNFVPPSGDIETKLAELWEDVLGIDKNIIGVHDDFFESGGHSLKATMLVSKIHKAFNVKISLAEIFVTPTIREMARFIDHTRFDRYAAIEPVEKKDYYPLSPAQKRLYILHQVDPASTVYNMPQQILLDGEPDVPGLQHAFRELIKRHESFRTSFTVIDHQPVQRVYDAVPFEVKTCSTSAGFVRSFSLEEAPLLRVAIVKPQTPTPDAVSQLLVDMHHIISDGVSNRVLVNDFIKLYQREQLTPLRLQYKDFSQWQAHPLQQQDLENQEKFWLDIFADEVPVLNLPFDYQRPSIQGFEGGSAYFQIDPGETSALKQLALREDVTLYMVLLAIINILLSKLSGQEDIVVGTPIAGRRHADLESIIGMFVNTLVMRNQPQGSYTAVQFLRDVKERTLRVFENQEYPFESLVEKASIRRDPGRNPLFDVMFTLQNLEMSTDSAAADSTPPDAPSREPALGSWNPLRIAKFDLTFVASESRGMIDFTVEYSTNLFKPHTIERYIDYCKRLITSLPERAGDKLYDIDIMPDEEKQRLLFDFNDTQRECPMEKSIHRLFEDQAEAGPDKIAVVFRDRSLTYGQLNENADRLAYAITSGGASPGQGVGIMVEKGPGMIIGLIAILKAGCGYLPVNPVYPEERKRYLFKDAGIRVLLTDRGDEDYDTVRTISVDRARTPYPMDERAHTEPMYREDAEPGSGLAYILYTSGSTGKPKGVMVEHRNVVRLVKNTNYYTFEPGQRFMQVGALDFDVSTFELWGPLLNGLELHPCSRETLLDSQSLKRMAHQKRITTVLMATPLFNQMVENDTGIFQPLRFVLIGGDVLSPPHINRVRRRFPYITIINAYGPTENATFSTTFAIDKEYDIRIPIGPPIANSTAYILDAYNRPVPEGVEGELFVGGHGVARGYLNRPELTSGTFMPNPFLDGDILYKTGDLARWLPGGNIEFLGRRDKQLKIRGMRIETGEIENHLLDHEAVSQAVVTAVDARALGSGKESGGDKYLCAYIVLEPGVLEPGQFDSNMMKEYLLTQLPEHMIPSYFVLIDSIPLTTRGKIDHRALPLPEQTAGSDYVPPADEIESKLVELWAEVLGTDPNTIGVFDDFFARGGHSLNAATLVSKIHKAFDVKITLADMFVTPTIRESAKQIRKSGPQVFEAIQPVERREFYPLAAAQERLYVLQQLETSNIHYNMPLVQPLDGDIDSRQLESLFRQLIRRHDSFRTSFHMIDGEVLQRVHGDVEFSIETFELPPGYSGEAGEYITGITHRFIRAFDLSLPPLVRVGLIAGPGPGKYLMVDMHHIISDGHSMEVLGKEVIAILKGEPLPAMPLQYVDYACWQQSKDVKAQIRKQETYWLDTFQGEIPVLHLPTDFSRPVLQDFTGDSVSVNLSSADTSALKQLASQLGVTLYMLLLASFNILLSKLGGTEDVVVGSPAAGRRHEDLRDIIGMFVNTLPHRNFPASHKTVESFVAEVKTNTLAAFENQDYPFEELVENVSVGRDTSRNPLFDVMFLFGHQDAAAGRNDQTAENSTAAAVPKVSKVDLSLGAADLGEQLKLEMEFAVKLFALPTIRRFLCFFEEILSTVAENPHILIRDIELMPDADKQKVLYDFNETAREFPSGMTLDRLFEECVERTPGNIALQALVDDTDRGSDRSLTYRQLDAKANGLARTLRAEGTGNGTFVGIAAKRSIEMVIGLLGILKAGGAYLPIEPGYPADRVSYMVNDSGIDLLLTGDDAYSPSLVPGCRVIDLLAGDSYHGDMSPVSRGTSPGDPAYALYTSGSTGRPKGVIIEHDSVINIIYALADIYEFGKDDVYLFKTPYVFDVSVSELFGWFLDGGRLAVLEHGGEKEPQRIIDAIDRWGVTHINFVPSMFSVFISFLESGQASRIDSLKYIFLAGEALPPVMVERFRELGLDIPLENIYGPTEATIYASYYSLSGWESGMTLPIGRPVHNVQLYILSPFGQVQPVGVPGELVLGGRGIARGYLNRPALTAEKFVGPGELIKAGKLAAPSSSRNKPASSKEYLYKTGDLCRWLPDGTVEYLGRLDHQVKIRGFRIELGEIESLLLSYPGVKHAVAVVREDRGQDPAICAYIEGNISDPDTPAVKNHLSRLLPDYMVPSFIMIMERIPLTASGKIDRGLLPAPGLPAEGEYIAPAGIVEEQLAGMWAELLGIDKDRLSTNANFFNLGGHSLKATIMVSRLHKVFDVKMSLADIFKAPTIRGLSKQIEKASNDAFFAIEPVEHKEYYRLSSAQKRLYILQQMDWGSTAYNMPEIIPVDPGISAGLLETAFNRLVNRHESLRTSFHMENGEPVQRIHLQPPFEIRRYEMHGTAGSASVRELLDEFVRPFDLSNPPLLRVGLILSHGTPRAMMVDMHHIITDGVSQGILKKDFEAFYSGETLAPLRLQYKDYCHWQNGDAGNNRVRGQEAYWLKQFENEVPVLNMPTDYPRPPAQDFSGQGMSVEIDENTTAALKNFALDQGTTLYTVMLSMFYVLLSRLGNQEDIVVGTPVAGRRHSDLETIIGMFVNTLALRNHPTGTSSFRAFLSDVGTRTLEAFENQEYPFEELVERVAPPRDAGRNPLFDVMFSLDHSESPLERPVQTTEEPPLNAVPRVSKVDLSLGVVDFGKRLVLDVEFADKLFNVDTVRRFTGYYQKILAAVLDNPGILLRDIGIMSEQDRRQVIEIFNDTSTEYPTGKNPAHILEERARMHPGREAVVTVNGEESITLTYGQLNTAANRLAHRLRNKGIGPDRIAGLLIERSIEMVAAIFGIWKAGGAYLPISPGYPPERIEFLLADSKAEMLVSSEKWSGRIPSCPCPVFQLPALGINEELWLGDEESTDLEPLSKSDNIAYIIYTSGTTGRPKGVVVPYRAIVNRMYWYHNHFEASSPHVFMQKTPFTFDVSVSEMTSWLLGGGKMIQLPPDGEKDPELIVNTIEAHRVTMIELVPSMLNIFLDFTASPDVFPRLGSLKEIITGAETLGTNLVKKYHEHPLHRNFGARLSNAYGPTETCIDVTFFSCSPAYISRTIPIGTPIGNVQVHILDPRNRPQPVGVVGEITVGGDCLSHGYLNRPELTAESFTRVSRDPGEPPVRLYKTGDYGRWMPDGNIEFLGRIDQQVKIRGHRVELGEIKNRLSLLEDVKDAVVIALDHPNGDQYLTAYIVSGHSLDVPAIKEKLEQYLPGYMIPAFFVKMEELPLTAHEKVDRARLPLPRLQDEDRDFYAPENQIQQLLVELWSELLSIETSDIGIDDDFFQLGGQSLKATVSASRIHKAFNVRIPLAETFKSPTVRRLAKYIEETAGETFSAIEPVENREFYRLSSAQKRLYILQQVDLESIAYNMPEVIPVDPALSVDRLENTFKRLIGRHESLRTSFHMEDGEPVQRIHSQPPFEIQDYDLPDDKAPGAMRQLLEDFVRPFDLSRAPLFRVGLIRSKGTPHAIVVDMHHIITDGVSHDILQKDFEAYYRDEELTPLRLQYKDYCHWQNGEIEKTRILKQESYWLGQFEGEVPVLNVPTDYPRPLVQDFRGHEMSFEVAPGTASALKKFALDESTTLYTILLSMFYVLLSKLGNQEDIVVGTPVAGRRHSDLETIIGMFVNTLALRNYPGGGKSFAEFLADVKARTLDAFENQEYPFEELVEQASPPRDAGRNPLFDVMFTLHSENGGPGQDDSVPTANRKQAGEESRALLHEQQNLLQTSKFDMSLFALDQGSKLVLTLQYAVSLYKRETIGRFISYFNVLVESILDDPKKRLQEIDLLSPEEREQVLYDFNDSSREFPRGLTLDRLFENCVEQTPGHIAVQAVGEGTGPVSGRTMTYRQLDNRVNGLARSLRASGVGTRDFVGIMAERSIEMVVGLLGILKAGAAYLPIEPGYPADRISYMVHDSGIRVLLTYGRDFDRSLVSGCRCIDLQARDSYDTDTSPVTRETSAGDPAYALYTSGSTGRPKGVVIEHDSVVNIIHSLSHSYEFTHDDVYLFKTPYVFDVSVSELFGWFLNGGRLAVLEAGGEKDPVMIIDAVDRWNVTHINFVPSMFNVFVSFLEEGLVPGIESLKYIFLAGEALPPVLVERFRRLGLAVKLENIYGPTEATIYASNYSLSGWESGMPLPIGRPLHNVKMYILSPYNGVQPIGVPGELVLGGQGIARGYLNRPELTAEKFVPGNLLVNGSGNSASPGEYLYKTGDLCRWLPDGNVEYLGRLDHQVKIRGFRIELGEIESLLSSYPGVKHAVAMVREDRGQEPAICAYISGNLADTDAAAVKQYLSRVLPDYMIPSIIVIMERIPLTPSGKIDRAHLPAPELSGAGDYIAPSGIVEEKLAGMWAELLGMEENHISTHANFFNLGGHSLNATVLTSLIHKEFQVRLPLSAVFKTPTISGLAKYIRSAAHEAFSDVEPVEKKEYYELSSAQRRLYILHQMDWQGTSYNIPATLQLEEPADIERLEKTFALLIQRHESLRTSFHLVDGVPVQRVHDGLSIKIRSYPDERRFVRPFDLAEAPLLRAGIFVPRDGKGNPRLLVDIHHIISDGVSLNNLAQDFTALYNGNEIPGLRVQYKDFAHWQNSGKEKERVRRQELFWMEQFAGDIPVLQLPVDYSRPAVQSFDGRTLSFSIDNNRAQELKQLTMDMESTPFMVVLSFFYVLLAKLGGQDDIIVGTPVAGRRHVDLQPVIGVFINTLALRTYPEAGKTFDQFLEEVKETAVNGFENQDYPFEDIVERAAVHRDAGRNPLFDVLFSFHSVRGEGSQHDGSAGMNSPAAIDDAGEQDTAKFDLTLTAVESGNRFDFQLNYSTRLFKPKTAQRFENYFQRIVSSLLADPRRQLGDVDIISGVEKEELLVRFNDTASDFPGNKTIHQVFEEQVTKTPDHPALVGDGPGAAEPGEMAGILTYRELNQRTEDLARLLRQKGAGPGVIVALMVERSVEMMIGIMGILKAGGAYMPVESFYPLERIRYMVADSGSDVMVISHKCCDQTGMDKYFGDRLVFLDDIPGDAGSPGEPCSPAAGSSSLAYVLYTSGTTGTPKGVMVTHRNVVNLVAGLNIRVYRRYTGPLRVGVIAPYVFDASVKQLFASLLHGHCLHILPEEARFDGHALTLYYNRHQVDVSDGTPAHIRMLSDILEPGEMNLPVRHFLIGGEVLPKKTAAAFRECFTVRGSEDSLAIPGITNVYGPTECCVDATSFEITAENFHAYDTVPIGGPMPNYRVYIVDGGLRLQPKGVPGQLLIGGDGVGRGYVNRPELTALSFVSMNISPGCSETVYKTGDLCRWLPDGNIEFLGRVDHQVKIRGFRIEPGEIEHQLEEHEGIKEAVVVVREDTPGDKCLAAYCVPEPMTAEDDNGVPALPEGLKESLARWLPEYMIPSFFIPVRQVPLTPNGKLDHRSLPVPEFSGEEHIHAPVNEVEKNLVEIWSGILGMDKDRVSVDVDFFKLGGHSLKAAVMTLGVYKEFGIRLPLAEVFRTPTVRGLARYLEENGAAVRSSVVPADVDENLVLLRENRDSSKHLFFLHDGTGEVDVYMELCNRLPAGFPYNCWGIKAGRHKEYGPRNLDVKTIAREYAGTIRGIQPSGPFYIAGWSVGGSIAFEVARQLYESGEQIGFCGLIDAMAPADFHGSREFSAQSEKDIIQRYLSEEEIEHMLTRESDIHGMWRYLVQYMEDAGVGAEHLRDFVIKEVGYAVPGYDNMPISEIVYYLNTSRTYSNARAGYTPGSKINAPLYYFAAEESAGIDGKKWEEFLEDLTRYRSFTLTGDHFSILSEPNVNQLAAVLQDLPG